MPQLMAKVTSLADLRQRARVDGRYAELAKIAARNLGGRPLTLEDALRWLNMNADETSERGVVQEVNFVRDLIKEAT